MAGSAETATQQEPVYEEYARSMQTMRRLGELSIAGNEYGQIQELAWADFHTAVTEMIKTDPEFRDQLDVSSRHEFTIVGGQVCAIDGTPVLQITEAGLERSQLAAMFDPEMQSQVVRDSCDVENVKAVNRMLPGQSRIVLSMDPKRELARNPEKWKELGYREGIAYLQGYSKTESGTVVAWAYSVDMSNETTWRAVFAELGVEVPEDESPNTWLRHAIETTASPEDTQALIQDLRKRYYQKRGAQQERLSINEYLSTNRAVLEQFFSSYYLLLARSVHTGRNHSGLQDLAASLQSVTDLKPEIRQQLLRVANSRSFDAEGGRTMDGMIRYAAVEELRKGLKSHLFGAMAIALTNSRETRPPKQISYHRAPSFYEQMPPEILNALITANVQDGVTAGRSYGGCSNVDLKATMDEVLSKKEKDPQNVFGGEASRDNNDETSNVACEYIHDGCYCCPYENDGSPSTRKITVRARRDNKGVARCLRMGCNAYLTPDGGKDIGDIARRALKLQAAKNEEIAA